MTEPVRSLTAGLTPLSMTATVTPAPRVTDQAAPTFEHAHYPLLLVLDAIGDGRAGRCPGAATISDTRPADAGQGQPGPRS